MRRLIAVAAVAVLCSGLAGCSRHVVVKPERVPSLGDPGWRVTSQPTGPPESAPEAPSGPFPIRPQP